MDGYYSVQPVNPDIANLSWSVNHRSMGCLLIHHHGLSAPVMCKIDFYLHINGSSLDTNSLDVRYIA